MYGIVTANLLPKQNDVMLLKRLSFYFSFAHFLMLKSMEMFLRPTSRAVGLLRHADFEVCTLLLRFLGLVQMRSASALGLQAPGSRLEPSGWAEESYLLRADARPSQCINSNHTGRLLATSASTSL